jgi:hypothetical protein
LLLEILRSLRVDALPAARRLGLVHEHAAILGRFSRCGTAWQPHLRRCHETILEAAARCSRRGRALVIGAGDALDVPVKDLVLQFDQVVLADVVISPVLRKLRRRFPDQVVCALWDATGALDRIAAQRKTLSAEGLLEIFRTAVPPPPPGGAPDFVVSANCLSQLGLVPSSSLLEAESAPRLIPDCAAAAAQTHLRWLGELDAVRVLLADCARIETDRHGAELSRENVLQELPLRAPDRTWRWEIAPIPEWHPQRHRIHEVGGWFDSARTKQ